MVVRRSRLVRLANHLCSPKMSVRHQTRETNLTKKDAEGQVIPPATAMAYREHFAHHPWLSSSRRRSLRVCDEGSP